MHYGVEKNKLFKDLLDLEKDFKYNLTLLKIREEEILRCDNVNRNLQEALKSSLAEIGRLNVKISDQATAIQHSERLRVELNEICQSKVNKLTADMVELVRKHHARMEDYRKKARLKEDEARRRQSEELIEKESAYRQIVDTTEGRLQEQTNSLNDTKKELERVVSENIQLRNKIRIIDSNRISESAFYKDERKTMQSHNAELNAEIKFLKKQIELHTKELAEIKLKSDDLSCLFQEMRQAYENLIGEHIKIESENQHLHEEVENQKKTIIELTGRNDELSNAVSALNLELHKPTREGKIPDGVSCNVPDHITFEDTIKQNQILRDVIKAMKNRESSNETENLKTAKTTLENFEAKTFYFEKRHNTGSFNAI